jgi:hypothetical protein
VLSILASSWSFISGILGNGYVERIRTFQKARAERRNTMLAALRKVNEANCKREWEKTFKRLTLTQITLHKFMPPKNYIQKAMEKELKNGEECGLRVAFRLLGTWKFSKVLIVPDIASIVKESIDGIEECWKTTKKGLMAALDANPLNFAKFSDGMEKIEKLMETISWIMGKYTIQDFQYYENRIIIEEIEMFKKAIGFEVRQMENRHVLNAEYAIEFSKEWMKIESEWEKLITVCNTPKENLAPGIVWNKATSFYASAAKISENMKKNPDRLFALKFERIYMWKLQKLFSESPRGDSFIGTIDAWTEKLETEIWELEHEKKQTI